MSKLIELPLVGAVNPEDIEAARAKQQATGKKGVFIQTLGCQMNEHDSEIILGLLEQMGYAATDTPLAADLIIYNTCSVRENPERKLYGQLNMLRQLKKVNPGLIVAVCGCMTQQKSEQSRLEHEFEHVDLVFGTHNIHRLPELLHRAEAGERVIEVWEEEGAVVEGLPAQRASRIKAYVTIMYGCNQFCTYCIVPYVRGRERSRQPDTIVREVAELAAQGYREVMLLGQNVNSYGRDLPNGGVTFAELLRRVDQVFPGGRIRFTSPHPKYFDDDAIAAMQECASVCEHVHLPAQAGNDRTLKRMGRRYTRREYLNLVEKMRRAMPGLAITTDLIVGFPGETEDEFADTLSLVREAAFDSSFMFIYSPRVGTPATRLPEQVPEEVKRDRIHRLIEVQNEVSLAQNQAQVGRELEVLVDGLGKDPGTVAGRTRTNKLVTCKGDPSLVGSFVQVRIESAHTWSLEGSLITPASGSAE